MICILCSSLLIFGIYENVLTSAAPALFFVMFSVLSRCRDEIVYYTWQHQEGTKKITKTLSLMMMIKKKEEANKNTLLRRMLNFFFVFVHFLCVMHQLQPLLIFYSERSKWLISSVLYITGWLSVLCVLTFFSTFFLCRYIKRHNV